MYLSFFSMVVRVKLVPLRARLLADFTCYFTHQTFVSNRFGKRAVSARPLGNLFSVPTVVFKIAIPARESRRVVTDSTALAAKRT